MLVDDSEALCECPADVREIPKLLGRAKSARRSVLDAIPGYRNGYGRPLRLRTETAKRYRGVDRATAVIWKMLMIAEMRSRRLKQRGMCMIERNSWTARGATLIPWKSLPASS